MCQAPSDEQGPLDVDDFVQEQQEPTSRHQRGQQTKQEEQSFDSFSYWREPIADLNSADIADMDALVSASVGGVASMTLLESKQPEQETQTQNESKAEIETEAETTTESHAAADSNADVSTSRDWDSEFTRIGLPETADTIWVLRPRCNGASVVVHMISRTAMAYSCFC